MQQVFDALADPRRRQILRLIRFDELPAGRIAAEFNDISRPAVSQHLRVLLDSGLVTARREGTSRFYRLDPSGIKNLQRYVSEFWDSHLQRLKSEAESDERNSDDRRS